MKKHELYFGVNLTRLVAEDYECLASYRLSKENIIALCAGYDLNAGQRYFVIAEPVADTTNWMITDGDGHEGENNPASRYFYGKGIALRLAFENLFINRKKNSQRFYSLEALIKTRNYSNNRFQENNIKYLESGRQLIYGFTLYWGRYMPLNQVLILKFTTGFGVRYLQSYVTRPGGYYDHSSFWIPGKKFLFEVGFPTVHLGLSLIINPAGTGAPKIEN